MSAHLTLVSAGITGVGASEHLRPVPGSLHLVPLVVMFLGEVVGGLLAAVLNGTMRQAKGHTTKGHTVVAAWVQDGPTASWPASWDRGSSTRRATTAAAVRSGSLLTVVRTPGFYS